MVILSKLTMSAWDLNSEWTELEKSGPVFIPAALKRLILNAILNTKRIWNSFRWIDQIYVPNSLKFETQYAENAVKSWKRTFVLIPKKFPKIFTTNNKLTAKIV